MCPMRMFLILFSGVLACYLAWRNYSNTKRINILDRPVEERGAASTPSAGDKAESSSTLQVYVKVSSGFWMLVDMACGRYLLKNIRDFNR